EAVFARLEIPLAPRRHDFQFGSERLVSHLEADLVVALAGTSVADGRGSFAQRVFTLWVRDHGPRERRAEQIFTLVHRARFQRPPNVAGQELFAQIFDDYLAGSSLVGLVHDGLDVFSLTYVGDHGDHFVGIVFLEPRNDDRGIEPTGVGENNLFFFRHARSESGSAPRRRPTAIRV